MVYLKQSTSVTLLIGPFVDSTDGNTAETALTIAQADVRLSKNGGNMAAKNDATSCTHDELGYYTCPLDATDTGTLGILKVMVHETGALPVWEECMVVTANVWDTLCSTEHFDVNVAEVSDDSAAADNLESACDNYSVTRGLSGTALPAAAADAAGGLPVSDAGGLDLDTQIGTDIDAILADTNELQTDDIPGAIAGLNDPTAATVADAVWDEAQADHVAAGSFGVVAGEIETIDGVVDAILVDTNELQTDDVPGTLATMDGKIDTIDANVDSVLVDTDTTIPDLIAALNDLSAADVNAEVVDGLNVDTYAEPGQGAPPATITIRQMIHYLYKWKRNLRTSDASDLDFYNDAGDTVDQTRTHSDNGTTYTQGEMGSGA